VEQVRDAGGAWSGNERDHWKRWGASSSIGSASDIVVAGWFCSKILPLALRKLCC
jgi:hypothetical protein